MIRTQPLISVEITRLDGADPLIPLPAYQTDQAAGMDVHANLAAENRSDGITLAPNERALIPTGFAVAIPEGFEMQVRPRSGLALKHGVTLVNAPGTIDADYRGPVGVILINHGAQPFTITHGERIAQLVLAPVLQVRWSQAASLSETRRGKGGFGSTGQ